MIIALLADLPSFWEDRLAAVLEERALALRARGETEMRDLLWSVPVSLVFACLEPLSKSRLVTYQQLVDAAPQAVRVCLASAEGLETIRREELVKADLWLETSATPETIREVVNTALELVSVRAAHATPVREQAKGPALPSDSPSPSDETLFYRLVVASSTDFDKDRLLSAYVEAVRQFARCAGYCLLWRAEEGDVFKPYATQGLPAQLASAGRLRPEDALPRWYLHNCRVLTRAELSAWSDQALAEALRSDLEAFRAQVALPLMIEGRPAGILLLGDKALGTPYSARELETLFLLSNYVALQLEGYQLHQQIARDKAYTERILASMSSGVITLGQDEKIAVCNPYAARVLGLALEEVQGQDVRALPSPLGDYLYAAFHSPTDVVRGAEISVRGGTLTLRVSTSHLADEQGRPVGSVLLLEDMTAEVALATERHRRERLDMLTQVVSSLAHEVRTPLTAIKTYAELAAIREPAPDLREFWQDTVMPQIDRLDSLIGQLVQLVQQPEPSFQLVRLEEIVREAVSALREESPEDEPVVEVEVARPLPWSVADPVQTRQALAYLLRFLQGEEHSPVHVRLFPEATESGEVITVSLQRLKRAEVRLQSEAIFDPLCVLQDDAADLRPAISRKIIENQGGEVRALVEDGRLEFQVRFPIASLTPAQPANTSAVSPQATPNASP